MKRQGNGGTTGRRRFVALLLTLAAAGAEAAPRPFDPVLLWNEQTTLSIQATAMDPFMATRALALESIAVLDTLRSAAGLPGFLVRLPAPPNAPPAIAASAGARAMLVYLFPARRDALDRVFAQTLAAFPADAKRAGAVAFGEAVAAAVIAIRDRDGWNQAGTVTIGTGPGAWRPTPPGHYPPLNPQWSGVVPFSMSRADQFRPRGPRAPGTKAFNDARAAFHCAAGERGAVLVPAVKSPL